MLLSVAVVLLSVAVVVRLMEMLVMVMQLAEGELHLKLLLCFLSAQQFIFSFNHFFVIVKLYPMDKNSSASLLRCWPARCNISMRGEIDWLGIG